ncbi:MAG TPA: TetR/AcrR family transcriptional regulator [Polyangiaceae bacterium]|nr:TetR/AcrR family transcriptional regulator [Polyangiaceae bacterium]
MTAKKRAAPRAPAGSAREEARGAYREAILAAAERVFVTSGFYAARMADIAKEARVAVGTLYNYFDSREAILSDLLSFRHKQFHAQVLAAAIATDPVERLRQIVDACFALIDENGALFATFMERGAVAEYDLERILGAQADNEYGEFLGLIDKTVRACVREKKFRSDVEPRLIVSMLAGAMNGATYAWMKRGRKGRLTSVTGDLFVLFLQGASGR